MNDLMSIVIKFYNQKEYVERALKAAFAQTYSPLEIIVIDDASTDGSYETAASVTADYVKSGGRHQVSLFRNEVNLERARTLERGIKLSRGELVFQADGDDMSLPNRVETVVRRWKEDGCRAAVIWSGCYYIDNQDNVLGSRAPDGGDRPTPFGAVNVYWRRSLECFPDAQIKRQSLDDVFFVNRAMMHPDARVLSIGDPLVFYRLGGVSSGAGGMIYSKVNCAERSWNTFDALEKELSLVAKEQGWETSWITCLQGRFSRAKENELKTLQKYQGTLLQRWKGFFWYHFAWYGAYFWLVDLPLLGPRWLSRLTASIYCCFIAKIKRFRHGKETVKMVLDRLAG